MTIAEQRDLLRAALAALVGANTSQELAELELGMRLVNAGVPDHDFAVSINAINALRGTLPETADSDVESVAKIVYGAMVIAAQKASDCLDGNYPKWFDGGNSTMQYEARRAARAIIELRGETT